MDKLDRLGWAAGTAFQAYGTRVGVRVNEPRVLDVLAESFPPGWKPAKSPVVDRLYSLRVGGSGQRKGVRRYNLLYVDSVRMLRTMNLDEVFQLLESDIQLSVAGTARSRLFLHAGVVGWRGRAIVLPGRSFTGKTTLVAALVRAGATYYSDEYAVLDSRGRVHPYPRPLVMRNGEETRKCPVAELGGVTGSKPIPAGLVILSKYKRGARWSPRNLSPGQAGLELLANTVSARLKPEQALAVLKKAVSGTPVWKGLRGEAEEVVESILKLLDVSGKEKRSRKRS